PRFEIDRLSEAPQILRKPLCNGHVADQFMERGRLFDARLERFFGGKRLDDFSCDETRSIELRYRVCCSRFGCKGLVLGPGAGFGAKKGDEQYGGRSERPSASETNFHRSRILGVERPVAGLGSRAAYQPVFNVTRPGGLPAALRLRASSTGL